MQWSFWRCGSGDLSNSGRSRSAVLPFALPIGVITFGARLFPDLLLKAVDTPYGPYADGFSEQQNNYGPFAPIREAITRNRTQGGNARDPRVQRMRPEVGMGTHAISVARRRIGSGMGLFELP